MKKDAAEETQTHSQCLLIPECYPAPSLCILCKALYTLKGEAETNQTLTLTFGLPV